MSKLAARAAAHLPQKRASDISVTQGLRPQAFCSGLVAEWEDHPPSSQGTDGVQGLIGALRRVLGSQQGAKPPHPRS